MPSDLESSLVKGGLDPAAAKIIANAISNAASAQLALGRRYGDATPVEQLRLVDGDTRRYVLTNLDYPADSGFAASLGSTAGQYSPRSASHPYADSQPATAQPTLATPAVLAGDYISANRSVKDAVSQTTVSLAVSQQGGQHARINPATKAVDAVPFSVEIDQKQFVDAWFEERPTGTVLRIRLKGLKQMTDLNNTTFWAFGAS